MKAVCAELEVPVEKLGKLLRIEDAVAACWRSRTVKKVEHGMSISLTQSAATRVRTYLEKRGHGVGLRRRRAP